MKQGVLRYNASNDRYGIMEDIDGYNDEWLNDGLHCGETLEARIGGKWVPTRIEYSHSGGGWYLVGVDASLGGLHVRR